MDRLGVRLANVVLLGVEAALWVEAYAAPVARRPAGRIKAGLVRAVPVDHRPVTGSGTTA
ncbi:hypothetical protein [Nonomuraea sp. 10N515B]|uniref:hypothetical protein n=1 Tax=Nonomuraea sp. 10N515B TaxID=3457422 RepID=UPI003FCC75D9